jgi:pimeloyl-ACP methyl ester carboxylesterase
MRILLAALAAWMIPSEVLAQRAYLVRRGRYIYVIMRPAAPAAPVNPYVQVSGECRLDWKHAASAKDLEGLPGKGKGRWAAGRAGEYQVLAPPGYVPGRPSGLVLFLGSVDAAALGRLAGATQKAGLLLAVPLGMGDEAPSGARLQAAVEVLDDLRRKLVIDSDRLYLAGISGGAVTASQIAYAWPEMCGGVLALGATGSLRDEPYLRDRARDRLTVVLMAGQLDAARHELERYRDPVLRDSGISGQMILVPAMAGGIPPQGVLEQALGILEMGRLQRASLAESRPAMRIAELSVPPPDAWSKALLEESLAERRKDRVSAAPLMLLHGVAHRWPAEEAGKKAAKLLEEYDARSVKKWEQVYHDVQLSHYLGEARAADAHFRALAAIPEAAKLSAAMRAEAIRLWEKVEEHGGKGKHGQAASKRLDELRKGP